MICHCRCDCGHIGHWARTEPAAIPQEYKHSWDIEVSYRVANQARPFTTSRNPSVRLMLFYFTMVLYNVWAMPNWIAKGGNVDDDTYVRPFHCTD